MATINGKSLENIFAELAVEKAPDKLLMDKYPYYKIDSYYRRVDSVIGMAHYNLEIIDRGFSTIASGQQAFTVAVRLTLIDDEGKVICYRDGIGTKEVTYNDNKVEVNLKNLEANAKKAAIKDCWHEFNIFGRRQLDENDSRTGDKRLSGSSSSGKTSPKNNSAEIMQVVTTEKMIVTRMDRHTEKPVYKVRGYEGQSRKTLDVIFYPNVYAECEEHMKLLAETSAIRTTSFWAKLSLSKELDGIPQYIFKGFINPKSK